MDRGLDRVSNYVNISSISWYPRASCNVIVHRASAVHRASWASCRAVHRTCTCIVCTMVIMKVMYNKLKYINTCKPQDASYKLQATPAICKNLAWWRNWSSAQNFQFCHVTMHNFTSC